MNTIRYTIALLSFLMNNNLPAVGLVVGYDGYDIASCRSLYADYSSFIRYTGLADFPAQYIADVDASIQILSGNIIYIHGIVV